jgi:hypothetical protein
VAAGLKHQNPRDRGGTIWSAQWTSNEPGGNWYLGAAGAFGLAAISASWCALAAELLRTPRQTEGPFYPLKRPAGID